MAINAKCYCTIRSYEEITNKKKDPVNCIVFYTLWVLLKFNLHLLTIAIVISTYMICGFHLFPDIQHANISIPSQVIYPCTAHKAVMVLCLNIQIDIRAEENARELQIQQLQNDNRLTNKLASNIGNAISDFGSDKSSVQQTFSDNLNDKGINVSPSDFANTEWNNMNGQLGAQTSMLQVLLAASVSEPLNVDNFVFQFMNKLTDIDVEWDDSILPQYIIGINHLSVNRYGTSNPLHLASYDLIFFSILYEIFHEEIAFDQCTIQLLLVTLGDRHNNLCEKKEIVKF